MSKRPRYCCQCRLGENTVEADIYVVGTIEGKGGRRVPYRGYLCDGHHYVLADDKDLQVQRSRRL